jgi:GNAT superfamily N-acetyltransferase
MPDLLVRLYELPDLAPAMREMARIGVRIRRPETWERTVVREWVRTGFGDGWADEADCAFRAQPASCFVGLERDALVGFACHDTTRRNFFGPTGVAEAARGKGVGRALLLSCLHAMRERGYAYAIVGGAGPVDYYERAVGATVIERSAPGIYDLALAKATRER